MVNNNDGGLNDLRSKVEAMEKEVKKVFSHNLSRLSSVLKQGEYKKEKKGKVNKKNATMYLCQDDSVKIDFENKEDAIKFFEGFK